MTTPLPDDQADMNDGDPITEPADEYGPEEEPPGYPAPEEVEQNEVDA